MLPKLTSRPENGSQLLEELRLRAETGKLRYHVPPDGNFNAELAIVAEAPGETELATKSPLTGGTGRLLWALLRRYGIERRNCWVTNVCKRAVSLGAKPNDRDALSRSEADQWGGLLRWELACLPRLRCVLVLGSPALAALSDHEGIEHWRGTVEQRDGITYVYTYNPAAILRKSSLTPVLENDLWKLDMVMRGHTVPTHHIEAHINPSPAEVDNYITKLLDEKRAVAYDIEVVQGETACIGFANNAHSGMCVNFRTDKSTEHYSERDEVAVWRSIMRVLSHGSTQLIAQNGNFDAHWLLYKDRLRVRPLWMDTLLGHHTLYPTLPHNLGFLTAQYTWHPYYKDEKDAWRQLNDTIERFWQYNVTDACITWACARAILGELKEAKLADFFFQHVMHLQPYLAEMTVNGIKCDVSLKDQIAHDLTARVAELHQEFLVAVHAATGDESYNPSPASPTQLRTLFFHKLGLVGRGTSTDDENRRRMLDHPRTPEPARAVIQALDKFKEEHKFLTTYARMGVDPDNRIRCDYKQYGTQSAPGRLSSSKVLWGTGMNLQNQPERAKPMFIADDGYTFVYFDLSQAEARVVGWLANINEWKHQFEKARLDGEYDCHRALASQMYKVPYDEVPKKDIDADGRHTIRYIAKRCRHGLNYRMGPDRLASVTNLSITEATQHWTIYHRINPELRKWWAELEHEARTRRELWTPLGRRLKLFGRLDDEALESIVAFKPQSTVGDHVSGTIYLCEEDDEWPDHSAIILNVHDALIAHVPIGSASRAASVMRRHAERPLLINGEPLIIPAEFAVAQPDEQGVRRWSTLKKVKSIDEISSVTNAPTMASL